MTYVPEARPRRAVRISAAQGRTALGGAAVGAVASGYTEAEQRLAAARMSRAHRQSRLRTLLNQRNEAIGAALTGRVPAAAIAATTGLKLTEVKKLGRAYSDSYAPDLSREQHVAVLSALAEQLRAVEEEKESAERQLRADVVDVLRSGKMDVFRIAALTAVTAERLRELTRGTGLRTENFRA
ncbi:MULTISPECIES: hypothetical protein [Arthrobacter]|uniref:hypothetical protein n=1 Tax=Arthrobacter TaxID=1663 RepID=UPI000971B4D7|nr:MULTISPECIES: hypothetical protein [Arthrobacter]APX01239.1 hypothetical protein BWQ92_05425 [Arthrobacter sp. QXT-31]